MTSDPAGAALRSCSHGCRNARPSMGSRDLMAGLIEIKMLVHACPLDTMRKNFKAFDQWVGVIVRDRQRVIRWLRWGRHRRPTPCFYVFCSSSPAHSYLHHQLNLRPAQFNNVSKGSSYPPSSDLNRLILPRLCVLLPPSLLPRYVDRVCCPDSLS